MSDRDLLRQIEALPDNEDAATPEPDVSPQVQATTNERSAEPIHDDAAEAEDDGPLSPADLVAESVRQDLAAQGIAAEESASTESPEPSEKTPFDALSPDEQLAIYKARAERADELEAFVREQEVSREEQGITHEYERLQAEVASAVAAAETHYANERTRLTKLLRADANRQADPDDYFDRHIAGVNAAVDADWRRWQAAKAAEAQGQVAHLSGRWYQAQWNRNREGFADHLITELKLARTDSMREDLLKAKTPEDMEERAEFLKRVQARVMSSHQQQTQAEREAANAKLKVVSTHPAQGGKPVRPKPVQLTGSAAELREIERLDRLSG